MDQYIAFTYPTLVKPYNTWSDNILATGTNSMADALTTNPYFTSLAAEVADFKAAGTAFSDQLAKCAGRDSNVIAEKNVLRRNLIMSTIQMGISVEKLAAGDPVILQNSKFPMRKLPQPVVVTKPTGLALTPGINPGELLVKIDGMKKLSLVIEYTIDPMTPDSQWESITCSTCSYLLTGLQPGKRYWVRVAAVGANKQTVWGDTLQSPYIQQL